MAWLVKTARVRRFTVPTAGGDRVIDLRNAAAVDAVKTILTLYKACPAAQTARFAAVLENAERIEPAPPHEPLYMGAAEARALHAAGMAIAAHSHTHPILARLDAGAQRHELQHCRASLEAAIGAPVDVLAYPVGGRGDFDSTTQQVARDCGYRAAFSCHGGINRPGRADPYDIKRVPVYWGAKPRQLLRG
jgi:peptidoglycan/xylan/chitin deacetylase (PgdA/CDA1 family)